MNKNLDSYIVPLPIPSIGIAKMNKTQQEVLQLIFEGRFVRLEQEKVTDNITKKLKTRTKSVYGDKATGKNTLIVVFGPEKARLGYVLLVGCAFTSIIAMVASGIFPLLSLIAMPAAWFGIKAIQTLYKYYNDRLLQPANAGTINMHFTTGLLFCVGIWLG